MAEGQPDVNLHRLRAYRTPIEVFVRTFWIGLIAGFIVGVAGYGIGVIFGVPAALGAAVLLAPTLAAIVRRGAHPAWAYLAAPISGFAGTVLGIPALSGAPWSAMITDPVGFSLGLLGSLSAAVCVPLILFRRRADVQESYDRGMQEQGAA